MSRVLRAGLLISTVSAALALVGLGPVHAAVPLPAVVSATPVSWTPNIFAGTTDSTVCQRWFANPCKDATVYSMAIVNGEVVVGGAFTQACQPSASSSDHCQPGTLVTRDANFAYQLGTGTIDPNFTPQLDQGPVRSVVAGPNNTVYIGGDFTTVNGETRNHGVVQLNVTPGGAPENRHAGNPDQRQARSRGDIKGRLPRSWEAPQQTS